MKIYLFLLTIFSSSLLLAVPAPPPPSPNREQGTPSTPPQANRVVADVSALLTGLVIPQSRDPLAHLVSQVESQSGLASLLLGHSRVHSALDDVAGDSRETKRPRQEAPRWDLSLDDDDEQPADFQAGDQNPPIEALPELDDALLNELFNHAELDRLLLPNAPGPEVRAPDNSNRDLISRLPGDLRRLILRYLTPMDRSSMRGACRSFKQCVDDARSTCHLTDTLPATVIRESLANIVIIATSYPHVYFTERESYGTPWPAVVARMPVATSGFSIWRMNVETNQEEFLQRVENMNPWDTRGIVTSGSLYFGDGSSFRRLDLKTRKTSLLNRLYPMDGRPQFTLVGDTVVYTFHSHTALFDTRTAELREVTRPVLAAVEIDGKPALVVRKQLLIFKDGLKQPPYEVALPEEAVHALGCGKNICLLTRKGLVLVNKDGVKLSTFAKVKCPVSGKLFPGIGSRCRFKSTKSQEGKLFDSLVEWHETHATVRSHESEGYKSSGLLLGGRYLMREDEVMDLMDMDTGKIIKLFSGFRVISTPIRVGHFIVAFAAKEGQPSRRALIKIDIRGYCSEEDPSTFQ